MDKTVYYLQMLDNGIVVRDTDTDKFECEKFCNQGRLRDKAMHEYLGALFWADVKGFAETSKINKMKITVTIEEDK